MAKQMNPMCIGATAIVGFLVIFFGVWAGEEAFHKNHSTSNGVSAGAASELKFGDANRKCKPVICTQAKPCMHENDCSCVEKVNDAGKSVSFNVMPSFCAAGTEFTYCVNGCGPNVVPTNGKCPGGVPLCKAYLLKEAEDCKQKIIAQSSVEQFDCTSCGFSKTNPCDEAKCSKVSAKFSTNTCLVGVKNKYPVGDVADGNTPAVAPTNGQCCNQPTIRVADGRCGGGSGPDPTFGNLPKQPCGKGGACYSEPCIFDKEGSSCAKEKCWRTSMKVTLGLALAP